MQSMSVNTGRAKSGRWRSDARNLEPTPGGRTELPRFPSPVSGGLSRDAARSTRHRALAGPGGRPMEQHFSYARVERAHDENYLFWLTGDASSLEIKVVLTPCPASSAHTYFYAGTTCACPELTWSCAPARRSVVEPGPMWPDTSLSPSGQSPWGTPSAKLQRARGGHRASPPRHARSFYFMAVDCLRNVNFAAPLASVHRCHAPPRAASCFERMDGGVELSQ